MTSKNLYVRDKITGMVRRIGDSTHDELVITKYGRLRYSDTKSGDSCILGERSSSRYEFVPTSVDTGVEPGSEDCQWK